MTNSPAPQIIPHSREAEEAVIGAVLINPEAYYDVAQFLDASDFYIHRHRFIWETFTRLHERRCPIDFITVTEDLDQQGQLAEVGGPVYLTAITNGVPTSLNAVYYGHLVEQTAIRRKMLAAANQVAKLAYQEEITVETALDEAEKAIFAVSGEKPSSDLLPAADLVERVNDFVTSAGDDRRIPTGLADLDRLLTGGVRKGDLAVIAGRPGMGKTGWLLTVLAHAAITLKRRAALFSMEMDGEDMVMRLQSQVSGIPLERIRNRALKDDDWPVYYQASETIAAAPLHIDDTPAVTPLQLRTRCRRLQSELGLDLVAVDYLQLMSGGSRFENRVQEVSYISRVLKQIARELDVPVIAAAQLSRSVEQRADRKPLMSDLRESGSIEQDSDIVMFLYRGDGDLGGLTRLDVAKHRNGPTGEVELVFRGHLTKFESAARRTV